jgi:hypothetical protein
MILFDFSPSHNLHEQRASTRFSSSTLTNRCVRLENTFSIETARLHNDKQYAIHEQDDEGGGNDHDDLFRRGRFDDRIRIGSFANASSTGTSSNSPFTRRQYHWQKRII